MLSNLTKIGITPLGSGSGGNAFVIHTGNSAGDFLVDAGFSRKELKCRMTAVGIDPGQICATLITHEHQDHIKGCRVFCDEMKIPCYISHLTADYLRGRNLLPQSVCEFEPGNPFELAGISVFPFPVPHDAVDAVGYTFECGSGKIALATDLGQLNLLTQQRMSDADILVIESNYDRTMLLESERRIQLKHRIMGRCGHLDNQSTVEALQKLLSPRTQALFLAHISRECNSRMLVESLTMELLKKLHRNDLFFEVLQQESPGKTKFISIETEGKTAVKVMISPRRSVEKSCIATPEMPAEKSSAAATPANVEAERLRSRMFEPEQPLFKFECSTKK